MSSPSRETTYAALFALLNGLTTGGSPALKSASRRLLEINDPTMAVENLPAAFQVQDDQVYTKPSTSLPPKQVWKAWWYIYAASADPQVAPSSILNPAIDAAVAALTPTGQGETLTLGGAVVDCAIEGNIKVFEGFMGDRCAAIIPIRIIVAGY